MRVPPSTDSRQEALLGWRFFWLRTAPLGAAPLPACPQREMICEIVHGCALCYENCKIRLALVTGSYHQSSQHTNLNLLLAVRLQQLRKELNKSCARNVSLILTAARLPNPNICPRHHTRAKRVVNRIHTGFRRSTSGEASRASTPLQCKTGEPPRPARPAHRTHPASSLFTAWFDGACRAAEPSLSAKPA